MKCPYCNQEMIAGTMFPMPPHYIDATYWLPEAAKIPGLFVTEKEIGQCDGLILTDHPVSDDVLNVTREMYRCPKCKILLKQYD